MKITFTILLTLACALIAASCGEKVREETTETTEKTGTGKKAPAGEPAAPPQKATVKALGEEHATQIDQMARALKRIQDSGSLERGEEVLRLIAGRIRTMGPQLEALDVPSIDEQQEISSVITTAQDKMEEALGAPEAFLESIPEGIRARVEELLTEIGAAMEDTDEVFGRYFHGDDPSPDLPQPEFTP